VHELLKTRRFVVLQGPPDTGKTRMADDIRRQFFGARGMTVQFHPAVTYEDFVVGLSPDAQDRSLRFTVREGWLAAAVRQAQDGPSCSSSTRSTVLTWARFSVRLSICLKPARSADSALGASYVQLTEVEAAFRALKSELAIRPICLGMSEFAT
jgi:hypothetical protein